MMSFRIVSCVLRLVSLLLYSFQRIPIDGNAFRENDLDPFVVSKAESINYYSRSSEAFLEVNMPPLFMEILHYFESRSGLGIG